MRISDCSSDVCSSDLRYLNRDPKRDFRRELPGDPAFSRAWKAVEEMGGAAATASKARADWRCLLGHPMQGPKGVAHILVALEFFELIKCSDVLGKNDRQWIAIATVRTKFPQDRTSTSLNSSH